jgi:hypothetical protein
MRFGKSVSNFRKIASVGICCALTSLMLSFDVIAQTKSTDGPFGVLMGSQIDSYKSCKLSDTNPGMYLCTTLPKPHPEFSSYVVQYHYSTGICWIKGLGREYNVSAYGTELIDKVDKIAKQIEKNYGKLTISDYLKQGSIWDDPEDWLMGVRKKERIYGYTSYSYELKNNVKSVYVGANVVSSDTGRVIVEFAFDNEDACEKAIQDNDGSAF